MVVLGPDSDQPVHGDSGDEDEGEGELLKVIMPPTIDQQGKTLEVK